jgi:hypothetical protein
VRVRVCCLCPVGMCERVMIVKHVWHALCVRRFRFEPFAPVPLPDKPKLKELKRGDSDEAAGDYW